MLNVEKCYLFLESQYLGGGNKPPLHTLYPTHSSRFWIIILVSPATFNNQGLRMKCYLVLKFPRHFPQCEEALSQLFPEADCKLEHPHSYLQPVSPLASSNSVSTQSYFHQPLIFRNYSKLWFLMTSGHFSGGIIDLFILKYLFIFKYLLIKLGVGERKGMFIHFEMLIIFLRILVFS